MTAINRSTRTQALDFMKTLKDQYTPEEKQQKKEYKNDFLEICKAPLSPTEFSNHFTTLGLKCKKFIEKKYQPYNDALLNAADNNDIRTAKFSLYLGANVNTQDNTGQTPLHLAVREECRINFVKFLIANKANVSAKDNTGQTPLHISVLMYAAGIFLSEKKNHHPKNTIIPFLIHNGADANAQDNFGRIPLTIVVQIFGIDPHDVQPLLIKKSE